MRARLARVDEGGAGHTGKAAKGECRQASNFSTEAWDDASTDLVCKLESERGQVGLSPGALWIGQPGGRVEMSGHRGKNHTRVVGDSGFVLGEFACLHECSSIESLIWDQVVTTTPNTSYSIHIGISKNEDHPTHERGHSLGGILGSQHNLKTGRYGT